MLKFKQYILEQTEPPGQKLKHITHIEDSSLYHGHEGVSDSASMLEDIHNHLTGKGIGKSKISTKYDGAPSLVFGKHPQTGQFFVASKSAFNKDPKINYTEEDIERNHGHAPGLVEKLKTALRELPKIAPHNGIYQGDVMYSKSDVEKKDGQYHFKPNTLTYSTNADSAEGKKIKNAKFGIVIHTKYQGKDFDSMSATPDVDRENFKDHPDVHNINPKVSLSHQTTYTPEMQKEFANHMENARQTYERMKPESFDAITPHAETIEAHVNDMVRKGGRPSTKGLIRHVQNRMQKEMDKVKTEAAKERKRQQHQEIIDHINNNKEHFDSTLELHRHMQNAKNVLIKALNSSSEYDHHIGDSPTNGEGFVVNRNGKIKKLVDRDEFSKNNFLKGTFQK
jgi:hypothetical protein